MTSLFDARPRQSGLCALRLMKGNRGRSLRYQSPKSSTVYIITVVENSMRLATHQFSPRETQSHHGKLNLLPWFPPLRHPLVACREGSFLPLPHDDACMLMQAKVRMLHSSLMKRTRAKGGHPSVYTVKCARDASEGSQ
nr:hypothetical protein CFP56_62933 [Quercus suber]